MNSCRSKKEVVFPMCLQKDKVDNLKVETDRGSRNMRNKGNSVRWTIIVNRTIVK
jgi:hypothetical protein